MTIHIKFAYNKFCDQFDKPTPWSFDDFCQFFEAGRDSDIPYQDNQGRPYYDHAADACLEEEELRTMLIMKSFLGIQVKAHSIGGAVEFKRCLDRKIVRSAKALQIVKNAVSEEDLWRKI